MASYKMSFFKFPFVTPSTVLLLGLLFAGCGQTGGSHGQVSNNGTANNFSSPIPAQLLSPKQKVRVGLTAKVVVDKGNPNSQTIDLTIDPKTAQVSGTVPDLAVGQHTFEIDYFINNIPIATATVNANIQENVANPVAFDASALTFPDTDGDGVSNLNEIEIFGSASDAWKVPATKPTVSVIANPDAAILPINGVQSFTAAVAQSLNQDVTWSVQETTGGTINKSGTYIAPGTPGTFHVMATSQADSLKSTTIAVTVVQPGTQDAAAFGTTTIGTGSTITALAVQSDGKIIAVGQATITGSHFTIARFNTDGSLDTTFGSGGSRFTQIGDSSVARAVVLQTDGKIIVGGDFSNGTASQFALVRYTSDGAIDTTFGTSNNGIVTTNVGSNSNLMGLAIQPDRKIVAVGGATVPFGTGTTPTFALVRYSENGVIDNAPSSFGIGGIVTLPIGSATGTPSSFGRALAIQADGKIVVAGSSNSSGATHITLARYNSNGTLDTTSFGPAPGNTGGIVTTVPSGASSSIVTALTIQADGKIVGAGNSTSATTTPILVRYEANGSLDTATFGTNGTGGLVSTTRAISPIGKTALVLQTDGKIILAALLSIARYNTDGSPDSTFGTNGVVNTNIGTAILGIPNLDVAIQPDGKVIIGGQLNSHFTLARFQTGVPPVSLRVTLTGDQEVPPVTTPATGSANFTINPGQTEIAYTLTIPVLDLNTITGVQIHLGAPGVADRPLFTLTTSTFVSPLTGKLTAADLDPTAKLAGVNTFADALNAMISGKTNIHIHTSAHQSGEIRGQILVAPPTLTSLQVQVFTPRCAICHVTGGTGSATANLFLDSAQTSFDNLVNVTSTEAPSLKRVNPGNPDTSYLIHKLEGTAAPEGGRCCTDRMPADGSPFLSVEEIKKVRDWISGGAKND